MPRVELRCHVGIKWGGSLAAATLRNISARGLQIEGAGSPVADWDLPPRDTFVSLFIDGLIIPAGEVVWRKGELAGIELMEELSWSSIMPWIREVDRRVQQRARRQPKETKLSSTRFLPACSNSISRLLPSIAAMMP